MLHSRLLHGRGHDPIKTFLLRLFLLLCAGLASAAEVNVPTVALSGVDVEIRYAGFAPAESVEVRLAEQSFRSVADVNGTGVVVARHNRAGTVEIAATAATGTATATLRVVQGWLSVLPPLIAIVVALLLRNVIPALLLGIWLGATTLQSFTPGGVFRGLLDSFEVFVVAALADRDHAAIILFSFMMAGMVGIITRNGGMAAVVRRMVERAKTAVGAQVSVWLLGLMIFFDDYSNTLVVGNTARALTDQLRVSREKLAYIVDSTAAPVVCLALATTWIGYEVGLVDAAIANIDELREPAYTMFLKSIPFSFYPILAILFVLAVSASGRDFGPMHTAESRARSGQVQPGFTQELPALHGDSLDAKAGVPERPVNAFLPIAVLVTGLLTALYVTGDGESLTEIIGSADAYKAMLWASFLGALTAAVLSIGQRILTTHEVVDAWFGGVRAAMFAMIVLVLAWSLSSVTEALHTADYLVSVLAGNLSPQLVPATVFVLSAVTAFTTGTSWGTMGILMPLVIPLCWAVMQQSGMDTPADMHILYSAIACNLAGAVWGDHCSPISDTTVLSSMASGCDHIEHVRTQMP
ncbi:MAG: Na+/H+ antiporter NhaC family protein, partial [Pseudomonadota bacterium]